MITIKKIVQFKETEMQSVGLDDDVSSIHRPFRRHGDLPLHGGGHRGLKPRRFHLQNNRWLLFCSCRYLIAGTK